MSRWRYLIEAEDRLRRLKRSGSQSLPNLKRYIRELQSTKGSTEAIKELVVEYKIIPGANILFSFFPENDLDIHDNNSPAMARWVENQLSKGNMYGWCRGTVEVRWLSRVSQPMNLWGIAARNVDAAIKDVIDHGLQHDAAAALLAEWPTDIEVTLGYATESLKVHHLNKFFTGKENEDWVRYI